MLVTILAIIAVTILTGYTISRGVDGSIYMIGVGIIGGLAGYVAAQKGDGNGGANSGG